jgi:SPP1 family predicted phage head-tail adaptor
MSKQLNKDVDGKITIRYRDDILPSMRIIHRDRILEIVAFQYTKEIHNEIIIQYKEKIG